ncbi:maestro heat-like repeat-containing protein family member 9 isoform X3 [Prionailurus iriomotensis]
MASPVEHIATSLWDVYSGLFGDQAMILAVNSSFVDPSLQFESQLKIIESSFKKVFSIPSLEKVRQMGNSEDDKEDIENLYQNILNMYEDTLLILVSKDLYKLQILKDMAMWMNEDSSYLQERAIVVISRVLSFASRKVRGYASVDAPCLGVLAAELSLLCCHNDVSITQQASLGMHHLLCIAKCQNEDIEKTKSTKYEKHGNHCLLSPSSVQEFVPKVLQRDRAKIAQSVGQTLTPSLLTDFVWSLLMTLSSPNCVTAFKASTILKLTLEYHAHKVTMVSKIVDAIYKKLRENSSHVMRQAMLRVTTLLTRTSPKKVIFQLMDYPVPADDSSESSVAPHVLKTILLILKGKPGEVHASLPERRRFSLDTTNMMPVAASQALCTLLPVGSYKKAVAQFFPQLLMALMLQVFYISELRLCYARDALRVLLNCSGLQQVDIALKKKNCWNQFSEELFHHQGVYLIAKTLSEYNFPQFPETLQYLYKLSVEGPRRSEDSVITVIFFTELLNNFFKDPFPEEFLVLFRNWVNDSNPAVSKLSLQKIANMAPVINEIENSNEGIRSMAIRHFGELLRDMSHYMWMLNDVVLGGLVPLILFLEDTDISVVKLVSHENYITDLISDTLGFLRSSRIYLRKASVILIGYLAKSGGHLLLRDEIEVMLEAIDRVLWDEDPIIRQLAEITHKIFKEIAHRLTSSHVKQTFRRLFHFIYIKKLKPLYNYNWPNNLASSPMKIKETDGDKEGLTDENYVYMFVKNET